MAAVFASVEADLAACGFTFSRAAIVVPQQGETHKSHAWEYLNLETRVRVTVRKQRTKIGAIPRCFFNTNLRGGRLLVTSPSAARKDSTEVLLENEIPDMPVHEQYLAHLDFVEAHAAGQPLLLLDGESLEAESARIWNESMRLQVMRGQVNQVGEGRYAYTIIEALRRAFRASAKVRQIRESQHTQATVSEVKFTAPLDSPPGPIGAMLVRAFSACTSDFSATAPGIP
jgi:hypothetical protein